MTHRRQYRSRATIIVLVLLTLVVASRAHALSGGVTTQSFGPILSATSAERRRR
jgi:hypothetical protein